MPESLVSRPPHQLHNRTGAGGNRSQLVHSDSRAADVSAVNAGAEKSAAVRHMERLNAYHRHHYQQNCFIFRVWQLCSSLSSLLDPPLFQLVSPLTTAATQLKGTIKVTLSDTFVADGWTVKQQEARAESTKEKVNMESRYIW